MFEKRKTDKEIYIYLKKYYCTRTRNGECIVEIHFKIMYAYAIACKYGKTSQSCGA